MTQRVLIECGAAETRAACLQNNEVIRFCFNPARGDEALPRPVSRDDIVLGRVRTISAGLKGAFVDIGEAKEAFLPLNKSRAIEGEKAIFLVKRPALGAKGALLSAAWEEGLNSGAVQTLKNEFATRDRPGALGEPVDAAIHAVASATSDAMRGEVEAVVDSPEAARLSAGYAKSVSVEESPFERHGADEALEAALERIVVLPGGARMIFDETEGAAIIDVDAGGAAEGATGVLNDKVNTAAANRLFAELSRRGIGGRVIVDFLPASDAGARRRLVGALERARDGIYSCRFGKLSGDGLFDLTAPRVEASLLEHATEPAGGDWPRPGRRFTLDWQAKAAIRALEARLCRQPTVRFALFAGSALRSYLEETKWLARLAARWGARFDLRLDEKLEDRAFDLAERR